MFFILAMASFVVAFALLLHHGYLHYHEDPSTSKAQAESCWPVCYFQPSDVCNFRTWNHEQFILLFFAVGIILMLVDAQG